LGFADRQTGVNLEGLPTGVAGVRLDQSIVDTLLLQPGQQEMSQPMRRDGMGEAGGLSVALEEESVARGNAATQKRLRQAGFAYAATIEQFDFRFRPELKRQVILRYLDPTFIEQARTLALIGRTAGMDNAFGDSIVVEVGDLLPEVEVLQERGTTLAGLERVVGMRDTQTLIRREVLAVWVLAVRVELLALVASRHIWCGPIEGTLHIPHAGQIRRAVRREVERVRRNRTLAQRKRSDGAAGERRSALEHISAEC